MEFRLWLQERWYQHVLEIEEWTGRVPDYPLEEYFRRYKWWLKREYKHQQKTTDNVDQRKV